MLVEVPKVSKVDEVATSTMMVDRDESGSEEFPLHDVECIMDFCTLAIMILES